MFSTYRRITGELLLSLFALGIVGFGIVHAIEETGPLLARLLELSIVTALSVSFVVVGLYMSSQVDSDQFDWVVYSTIGLGVLTGALSLLSSAVQLLQGYSLNEPIYYAVTMLAGGAAAGPYIGYFYGQLQQSNAKLSHRYEEMAVLNRRLSVANRVLRHNLRNNLTVLTGVTNDLQSRVKSEPMADRVEMLDRRTEELTALSNTMGEIQQVWNTNQRTTVDLVSLTDRLLAELQTEYPTVTVQTDVPPSATVVAHPKIEAALWEILQNAVQHNNTSALEITVTVTETKTGSFEIRIADSGGGMPDIEEELFAEADPTTSALEHGIGLGLWMVYWTAEKSGGTLSVSTDDGAVVSLTLPCEGDSESTLVRPTQTLERKQPA